jgi:hypothetical protein
MSGGMTFQMCIWSGTTKQNTPLILDTGNLAFTGNGSKFKLELSWFNNMIF